MEERETQHLANGVLAGDRAALARAITLVESRRPSDRDKAATLLEQILPHSGKAQRVGITGVPGVGKSTFIESYGLLLTGKGHRVAVLAVDPSSGRSGGSILGDKTRMERLSREPNAYIRPSPSGGMLGGVARATRESIALCEAAGFDHILVETVGAGQSEYAVADMTDLFLVLMLPGAGDELQGIKKGVLEMADMLAVNKADRAPDAARRAVRDLRAALSIVASTREDDPAPQIFAISALTGEGMPELHRAIEQTLTEAAASGRLEEKRRRQRVKAMWGMIEGSLLDLFLKSPHMDCRIREAEAAVAEGRVPASTAAMKLLRAYECNEG